MQKYITYLMLWAVLMFFSGRTYAQDMYKFIQDSAYFYAFDGETVSWTFSGAIYYYGEPGYVDSTLTTGSEGQPVSKSIYKYENGLITDALTQVNIAGEWINSQHQVFFYNIDQLEERIVTNWGSGQWQNLNRFTYFYDNDGYLKIYKREIWRNTIWNDYAADSLFYDESGMLVERSGRHLLTEQYITRTLYQYNILRKKIAQVRQDFINNEWRNISMTHFYYNKCGTQTMTETEKWSNESWQPDSRSEIFYHAEITPGTKKVPVCHNGKTLYVSVNTLDNFLERGACLGECTEEQSETKSSADSDVIKSRELPFIVYPNPSREWITVKMVSDECPATDIVLLDYSGRLVQTINPGNRTEIPIDLSNLKSGSYILKVTAATIYSTVISKQ